MKENQNKAQNIDVELDTKWIIIYWKQGAWKTATWILIAINDWPKRIYSNTPIYKNWKLYNKVVQSIDDIKKIRFSYTPWVIIIDEAWINASSRNSMSDNNKMLSEILFLIRKINCSIIWIAQNFENIDVNARRLADLIIKMRKIRRYKKHPLFIMRREKQIKNNLEYFWEIKVDTITILKKLNITYNTLESSKFTLWNKKNV